MRECAYAGSKEHHIPECKNLVNENKIFCKWCFQIVSTEARKNWKLAFPYDVPYDLAMRASHADQRAAILRFQENITFAKRQLSLFAERET